MIMIKNYLFRLLNPKNILYGAFNTILKRIHCFFFYFSEHKDHLEVKHSPGSIQTSHFFGDFLINEIKKNF